MGNDASIKRAGAPIILPARYLSTAKEKPSLFAAPAPAGAEPINILELIPAEHRAEAERFFREIAIEADLSGITVAEALANVLRPHLRVLRRAMGVEAFEERALTITDVRGNLLSFTLVQPDTRHLSAS